MTSLIWYEKYILLSKETQRLESLVSDLEEKIAGLEIDVDNLQEDNNHLKERVVEYERMAKGWGGMNG